MKLGELDWSQVPDADDMLLDLSGCTVSILIRGRNAWHSTWVRHWFRHSHIFSDHRSAQLGAEDLRGRGSVFYVRDRPAVLMRGVRSTIVVFDGFSDQPFQHFSGVAEEVVETAVGSYCTGIFPGVTLQVASERFGPSSEFWSRHRDDNQVRFGLVPGGCELEPLRRGPFRADTSYPQGTDYYLGWSRGEDVGVSTVAVRRQGKAWSAMLADHRDASSLHAAEDWPALTDLLGKRFTDGALPARSRAALRERFEEAIAAAADAVAQAELEFEAADHVDDEAWEALCEAEEFAEDPWSALREADASSEAIRQARERATNARRLVEEAQDRYEATTEALEVARERVAEKRQELRKLEAM